MIPLRLASNSPGLLEPIIARLMVYSEADALSDYGNDATFVSNAEGATSFTINGQTVNISSDDPHSLDGDVVLINPGKSTVHRIIRKSSRHNSLLVTEQCDQLCIMCSQPPKAKHADFFDVYKSALLLAPEHARITITGGEPLLHKSAVFDLIQSTKYSRPDIRFHVLTNGQHFEPADLEFLNGPASAHVSWGIPLYAAQHALHDQIVAKPGAFARLEKSMQLLCRSGAEIELRTVVLQSNIEALQELSLYVGRKLPFVKVWAIMQLENIGFGRMNWDKEFFDHSRSFDNIGNALDLANATGIETLLYNFPLCTVPAHYRNQAVASISDWKNKYLEKCEGCSMMKQCAGFFEWHPKSGGYERLVPQ